METPKTSKGKGFYMKIMSKTKAKKVMQTRANSRWAKATPEYRHDWGLMLANARRVKRIAKVV